MKKLEELGISPAPWDGVTFCHPGMNGYVVSNANLPEGDTRRKIVASDVVTKNARLIAAAPDLYEALLEALPWLADIGAEVVGNECADKIAVVVAKAEAALSKASGESEVSK